MSSEEVLEQVYKPYRVTLLGKVKCLETMKGKFVVKSKGSVNIRDVYGYLVSRSFDYFPRIVDDTRSEVNVFEYVEGIEVPKEQALEDLIGLVALLHNKTSYYKEVTQDKYKEIYEDIRSNIEYLKRYYEGMYEGILLVEFMSPSEYLFCRNYSVLVDALSFCDRELDEWYRMVQSSDRQRVALLHNNLALDHYIRGDKDYLVSWDNCMVDTPVWDVVKLYRKEFYGYEFSSVLSRYLREFSLNEDERKLLFILLALPDRVEFMDSEYESVWQMSRCFDYIYKTEALMRPYYAKEEEEE